MEKGRAGGCQQADWLSAELTDTRRHAGRQATRFRLCLRGGKSTLCGTDMMTSSSLNVGVDADEILGDSENGEDSYAAAAMVQAALNAMACFSPVAKPLDLPPTELKPTSPIAAAMVVQVSAPRMLFIANDARMSVSVRVENSFVAARRKA